MINNIDSNKTSNLEEETALVRLPCRGCTSECKNYNLCQGKLWRIDDFSVPTKSERSGE